VGKNAPPVVPISGNFASPIKGEATLTDAQALELQGGRWYFNVHTDANKGGEIRGQVTKK
jgi:CHRD domain